MLNAALAYAAQGFAVFPCQPRGKTPAIANGHNAATTDARLIREWWDKNPDYNVGLVAGNGLAVLDVDVGKGGTQSLRALLKEHGPLSTLVIRTGSGGLHFYMKDSIENPLPQSASVLGPGLDIRAGSRGYVIAAPS